MVELVILTVGVLAIVGAVGWHVGREVWARRLVVRRRVVVNLVGGSALSGVLWRRVGGVVVLRDARLLEPGADPVGMDGDVLVERDQVRFVQVAG